MVVYDSVFGNTEKIALAISKALGTNENVKTVRVESVSAEQLRGLQLLIVGSPTQKFKPLKTITSFLKGIGSSGLQGVQVAAFDTRISVDDVKSSLLRFMVRLGGYAAKPIANRLQKCGGDLIMPPEGFLVKESEGPLKEGELERAVSWTQQIITALKKS